MLSNAPHHPQLPFRINPLSFANPASLDTSLPPGASSLGALEDSHSTSARLAPGLALLALGWGVGVTWLSWCLPGLLGV